MKKTFDGKILTVANALTFTRIVGSVVLLFTEPMSYLFFAIYSITGITDALDGFVARATKTASEFGARLDSISDLTFYSCLLYKIFPIIWELLQREIWYTLAVVLIIRAFAYVTAYLKFGRFAAVHTYMNKLTGLMVFLIPYAVVTPAANPFCWCAVIVAGISSTEEFAIHLTSEKYSPSRKCFFMKPCKDHENKI